MKNETIFKKEMIEIPHKATTIQDELDRAVWNGNVSKSDMSSSIGGADFARSILREVRQTSDSQTKSAVGGIGIVFDSTPQFESMLQDALPKNDETMFSFFTEKSTKKIISCSNNDFNIGDPLEIDEKFFTIKRGETLSRIVLFRDKYYIVGACCSSGYREYKSKTDQYHNDIIAFVFIEAGKIKEDFAINKIKETTTTIIRSYRTNRLKRLQRSISVRNGWVFPKHRLSKLSDLIILKPLSVSQWKTILKELLPTKTILSVF